MRSYGTAVDGHPYAWSFGDVHTVAEVGVDEGGRRRGLNLGACRFMKSSC